VAEAGGGRKVTKDTLFQAASVSKPVSAMGALRLVQEGKVGLDEDVNKYLRTWKVPPSPAANGKPVTLRELLSHSAGLNVHGFGGYEAGKPRPTLLQVLDGKSPADSAPIRVEAEPGVKMEYSGGGYCVIQQLIEDVTGQPFPAAMKKLVLDRAGMATSTFEQPIPAARADQTASGHGEDGAPIAGRWHVYPEMAAAGLWTTATDLVHFGTELAKSAHGRSNRVLNLKVAGAMLSRQKGGYGLGVALSKEGARGFMHGGSNAGFRSLMLVLDTGHGFAILTNGDNGDKLNGEVLQRIAQVYAWPPNIF
jgi:CubicO group peptidase (beta-lactamase class C family)